MPFCFFFVFKHNHNVISIFRHLWKCGEMSDCWIWWNKFWDRISLECRTGVCAVRYQKQMRQQSHGTKVKLLLRTSLFKKLCYIVSSLWIWHCFIRWTAFVICYYQLEILTQKIFLSDLGYQSVDAYQTLVVTVWIPFVDSNEQNGCMQVQKLTSNNVLLRYSSDFDSEFILILFMILIIVYNVCYDNWY